MRGDKLRRQMGVKGAQDSGRTGEVTAGEKTGDGGERRRQGLRECGCEGNLPGPLPTLHFSRSGRMEDFRCITHHETDYSGTEGRRKREIKEREEGRGAL